MRRLSAAACCVLTVFAVPMLLAEVPSEGEAQTANPEAATERYRILDTRRLKTMQQELDEAAAAGYRVISGDAGFKILALERDPDGRKHQYLVTDSLFKMAKDGKLADYRVLPFTFASSQYTLGAVLRKTISR